MPDDAPPELSEYEKIRARNIERNNAKLRELGLISKAEERASNDAAWRRHATNCHHQQSDEDDDSSGGSEYEDDDEKEEDWEDPRRPHGAAVQPKEKRNKKKRKTPNDGPPTEGSRKSRRLQGFAADGSMLPPKPSREEIEKEREERVRECREVRLRAARAVAEAGAEKAAKENPTATYEHCLMRVKTMSDKGLQNRVKAIERAAGKHCVVSSSGGSSRLLIMRILGLPRSIFCWTTATCPIFNIPRLTRLFYRPLLTISTPPSQIKMAIFKSCLQDEGMWDLAELASEALERLKGLKAPVA